MVLYWITALKIKYWYVCQFYLFKFIQSLTFDFERFFKAFLPTRLQDWRAKHLPAHYGTLNVDPSSIELILKEVKDQTKHARSELQRIVSFFFIICWMQSLLTTWQRQFSLHIRYPTDSEALETVPLLDTILIRVSIPSHSYPIPKLKPQSYLLPYL